MWDWYFEGLGFVLDALGYFGIYGLLILAFGLVYFAVQKRSESYLRLGTNILKGLIVLAGLTFITPILMGFRVRIPNTYWDSLDSLFLYGYSSVLWFVFGILAISLGFVIAGDLKKNKLYRKAGMLGLIFLALVVITFFMTIWSGFASF